MEISTIGPADAEAICEAVTRQTMRFAPIKSREQQAALSLHRVRSLLIKQRIGHGVGALLWPELGAEEPGRSRERASASFYGWNGRLAAVGDSAQIGEGLSS